MTNKELKALADIERVKKLYKFEDEARDAGYKLIAGTDEAGRGALAGDLTVAAVILPPNLYIPYLNDSKKLLAKKRETVFDEIMKKAIAVSCVRISPEEVDKLNVFDATLKGMFDAVQKLPVRPDYVLTDAMKQDFGEGIRARSVVHGDALSASIAAASIIAKVTRDRLADEWHKLYPIYGFDHNRGYGTKFHIDTIKTFGYTPIHRKTFSPVKELVSGQMNFFNSAG